MEAVTFYLVFFKSLGFDIQESKFDEYLVGNFSHVDGEQANPMTKGSFRIRSS